VLLPPNTAVDDFNQQLTAYARKAQSPDHKDSYTLQAFSEVHYDTQTGNYSNKAISR